MYLYLPSLLHKLLHIRKQLLRLLQRREVTALLMLIIRHQIPLLLNRTLNPRVQLTRKEREAKRLADERKLFTIRREEYAVRVYGAGESLGEPVQGDVGEYVIDGGGGVAPFKEFLANPGNGVLGRQLWKFLDWGRFLPCQQCERVGREHKTNCAWTIGVFQRVGHTTYSPLHGTG